MRRYQIGSPDTFWHYTTQIDSYYLAVISLTRGGVRWCQHIWTYDCVPAFVGNDYFCESGVNSVWNGPSSEEVRNH